LNERLIGTRDIPSDAGVRDFHFSQDAGCAGNLGFLMKTEKKGERGVGNLDAQLSVF